MVINGNIVHRLSSNNVYFITVFLTDSECFIIVYSHLLPLTVLVFGSWVRTPAVVLISVFLYAVLIRRCWHYSVRRTDMFITGITWHLQAYECPLFASSTRRLLLFGVCIQSSIFGPVPPTVPLPHPSPPPPQSIGLNTLKWGAPYAWKKTDLSKLPRPLSCLVVATLGFIYHAFVHGSLGQFAHHRVGCVWRWAPSVLYLLLTDHTTERYNRRECG